MRAGSMVVKALLIGLLGSGVVAVAQAPAAVLVELFTSEGCSSCPPADSLLEQMVGKHAPSGQLVITLSEHVTYWNHDGWVDPFSQELFTERQNAYARRFHLDSPYTPQMVIDGNRQVVGNDGGGILKAIGEEARGSGGIRIVSIKREGWCGGVCGGGGRCGDVAGGAWGEWRAHADACFSGAEPGARGEGYGCGDGDGARGCGGSGAGECGGWAAPGAVCAAAGAG
jgi:hypothetical protein